MKNFMFYLLIGTIIIFTMLISNLQAKVENQQIIIEELVNHTGYNINIPCGNVGLFGGLGNLELRVDNIEKKF